MAAEFQGQFQEAMREAEMADLKKSFDEVKEAASGFTSGNVMTSLQKDVSAALNIEDVDKPAPNADTAPIAEASNAAPAEAADTAVMGPQPLGVAPENPQEPAAREETARVPAELELPGDAKAS
jgi:sec-independent protein translocase protein TatB